MAMQPVMLNGALLESWAATLDAAYNLKWRSAHRAGQTRPPAAGGMTAVPRRRGPAAARRLQAGPGR